VSRSWRAICAELHDADDVLAAFAGPHPRGGPPPPPEPTFAGGFASLEAELLGDELAVGGLLTEVDGAQAAMFARRLGAADALLAGVPSARARVLRVGLRMRLRGVLRQPGAAVRARALADFYASLGAAEAHAARGGRRRSLAEAARVPWRPVAPGLEEATIDGAGPAGPLRASLLRADPRRVRLACRACPGTVDFPAWAAAQGALAATSGGFFLYSEPDIEPPSARYDPVGLLVADGQVLVPPLLARTALLATDRFGIARPVVAELNGARVRGRWSRAHGLEAPVAGIAAVGARTWGPTSAIPLNGAVLDVDAPRGPVRWARPRLDGVEVQAAMAGGPRLLQGGRVVVDYRADELWGSAPPVTFAQDETGDRNLLPRLGAGLDAAGRLVLAAVDGRHLERSLGLTLRGLAELLAALGCVDAVNLDGGSSKRMVVAGELRDLPSTELRLSGTGPTRVRPVHTALLLLPR
jgi:hypothetical protein